LELEPRIAEKCCFTGMFGSIACGLAAQAGAVAEYNVVCDIPAAQRVFSAPWKEARLTPLDSCGQIRITGENFQKLLRSDKKGLKLLMAQYDRWHRHVYSLPMPDHSSVLFDTAAVHLAQSTEFFKMRRMNLTVDDEGFTREDPAGMPFETAAGWEDLAGFENYITQVFLGELMYESAEFRFFEY
jgi:inosine-uridine nucleoside N-ribohydrolase